MENGSERNDIPCLRTRRSSERKIGGWKACNKSETKPSPDELNDVKMIEKPREYQMGGRDDQRGCVWYRYMNKPDFVDIGAVGASTEAPVSPAASLTQGQAAAVGSVNKVAALVGYGASHWRMNPILTTAFTHAPTLPAHNLSPSNAYRLPPSGTSV
ncbi:hypothetical protein NP233_g3482 [Leucocoprinus birnbaumii]|uniref:Uncharacterized protein n=1 Tax=Leucocoprinus birnbaumii TaxID=56174 RepID=A0AAD5YTU9_9AGAR|nr:hypothetical protein NP233_g3482 [Leucocoprinus birnbaumii]